MNERRGRFYLTRWLSVGIVLAAAQLACSLTGAASTSAAPTQKAATTEAAAGNTSTPAEATQASGAEPTATQQKAAGGGGGGFACFGSAVHGVTCLTDSGWKTYSEDAGLDTNGVLDMAVCPDGKIYAATSNGLDVFDGQSWTSLTIEGAYNSDYVACAADGSVWVSYFQGISRYKDGAWQKFDYTLYDTGEISGVVYGLDVAPDGTVWEINANSISSYDGKTWKEYKQGKGFDGKVFFDKLTVDAKGRPWATDYENLYVFDGGTWKTIALAEYLIVESLAADPQGRIWVNTADEGVKIYADGDWSELNYANGDIHSHTVRAAVFDGSGRTWLAESYGIEIQSGGSWTTFRMDNADLADNEFQTLAVSAKGPVLPGPMTKQTGSIAGSITRDGKPMANAKMEFCVEKIILSYSGSTPCANQPFLKGTTTGADGKFSIADLPPGYYVLTLQVGEKWAQLGFMGGSDRVLVKEGKQTDVGELTVTSS